MIDFRNKADKERERHESALTFLNEYCDFSNPNWVWMLKGISRNKDNTNSGVKFLRRMVLTKPEDIVICRDKIIAEANDPNTIYRLYVSLNARDVVKAAFEFQKKLADITFGLCKGQDDALGQSKKIGSVWKTQLEQRNCRGTKRFLLDVDTLEDDSKLYCWMMGNGYKDQFIKVRKTVSGWHWIINACDTRSVVAYAEKEKIPLDIQRDSMVYVEQWKGSEV